MVCSLFKLRMFVYFEFNWILSLLLGTLKYKGEVSAIKSSLPLNQLLCYVFGLEWRKIFPNEAAQF